MHPAAYRIASKHGGSTDYGSGTAIDRDLIVTAAHVVRGSPREIVVWQPGWKHSILATKLAVGDESRWGPSESDVTILKLERPVEHWVSVAETQPAETATAYGWTSGPLTGRAVNDGDRVTFHRGARGGDSGGGLIVRYKGPEVLVGLISSSGGGRTYGPGINPIRKLLARCKRKPIEPPPPPPVELVPVAPEPRWIAGPVGKQGPVGEKGPVGDRGPTGQPADTKRIAELEKDVAGVISDVKSLEDAVAGLKVDVKSLGATTTRMETKLDALMKRLDNFSVERTIEVTPVR
jgi:hypothetical protein